MKVAIVGSRDYKHLERVVEYVNELPEGTVVVSGGARGVDKTAERAARARGLKVELFLPDYKRYAPGVAPLKRNVLIAEYVDRLVAFWDGKSRGTMHVVREAEKRGKIVERLYGVGGVEAWCRR